MVAILQKRVKEIEKKKRMKNTLTKCKEIKASTTLLIEKNKNTCGKST